MKDMHNGVVLESVPGGDPYDCEIDRYNRRIGERIRAVRSRRSMIRKDLSRHSGVSERYLAQAESGQANISIALLWRIAHALEVKLIDLLPEGDAASLNTPLLALLTRLTSEQQECAFDVLKKRFFKPLDQVHGVALIGLRGAGKSQLGRLLADKFQVPFIRLGDLVEQRVQMSLGELFSLGGQKTYRRLEKQSLDHVLQNHPLAIIETGGSLVTQPDTFNLVLEFYFTVWIKAAPEEHMRRVLSQGDLRPMEGNTQAMDDLKMILTEREAEYRQAHYILDTSGRNVSDCFLELARQCRPYLLRKQSTVMKSEQRPA